MGPARIMLHSLTRPMGARLAIAALLAGGFLTPPALADVKEGIDAWSRGDDTAAVHAWEAPAEAGDPEALFNLAQAYRLGRGVAPDPARAEALYARAAASGHAQAADTYGLMLFEQGRHAQAMPYLRDAARRGDPRAQYLLGIAHFNGDDVERDWPRAYALMTLANAFGLPQAAPALAEMDRAIPLAQRQQAAALAERMKAEADGAHKADRPALAVTGPAEAPTAAAGAALADARRTGGTDDLAQAGASQAPATRAQPADPAPRPAEPSAARAATSDGPWRVQLGAFAIASNAEALWKRVERRGELAGARRLMLPTGRVTVLQAGGFPSRAAAQAACTALKRSGYDCLVTDR